MKVYITNQFGFLHFLLSIFHQGRCFFKIVDCIEFYPNNTKQLNNWARVTNFVFKKKISEFVPVYYADRARYSSDLWYANDQALNYLEHYEAVFRGRAIGLYLSEALGSDKGYIAYKKDAVETIAKQILLLTCFAQDVAGSEKVRILTNYPIEKDLLDFLDFELNSSDVPRFSSWYWFCSRVASAVFYCVLNPYVLRGVWKRGLSLKTAEIKRFKLAQQICFGFHEDEDCKHQAVSDESLFKASRLPAKQVLFVLSRWRFTENRVQKYKEYVNELGASFVDEENLPLQLDLIFNHIIKAYIKSLKLIFSRESASWEFKVAQVIIWRHIEHLIFCSYFHAEIYFSRDDYSSSHIVRTVAQNSLGLKNFGLQHSAFLSPKFVPQSAHVYFDNYFLAGKGFAKLWDPFWSKNKKNTCVGLPKAPTMWQALLDVSSKKYFDSKYGGNVNVLLPITADSDTISPDWLMRSKYEGIEKIVELDPKIHLILRPRNELATMSFLGMFPKIKELIANGRCSIEDYALTDQGLQTRTGLTTFHLMANVDVLIAEDASSSLLESLCRDDLFSFYFMIRYRSFEAQRDIVAHDIDEVLSFVSSFLSRGEIFEKAMAARKRLRDSFFVMPPDLVWQRIAGYLD